LKNPDWQAENGSLRLKSAYRSFLQKSTKEKPQRLSNQCGYKNIHHYYVEI
jgi:hypothetical protein